MTSPAIGYTQINDFSDELGTTLGLHLDQEFASINASLASTIASLGMVQRSDGKLLNASVRLETLHAETLRTLMIDATVFKGAWFGGDPYFVGNLATFGGALYLCAEQHYANVFADDLAAGKWYSLSMGGSGSGGGVPVVVAVPTNPSEVGDAQVVFNAFDAKLYRWNTVIFTAEVAGADIVNGSVTATKLASDSVTTAKIVDAAVTTAKLADDSVTSEKLAANVIQAEHLSAGVITADKINSNGLVIRNADGSPILGVGTDLDMARVFGLNDALDAVSAVFMWIAYANNSTGTSGFTTGAWTNQTYIGVATNKTTATESTDPADYVWSLFKGADGQRGSRTFYVSGASSWSDASATSAASVSGGPVINDIVTEYGSGFSQTKFWDGATWQTISAAIDGNLLVSGTVGSSAIAANSIIAGKIAANSITAAGGEIADATITNAKIANATIQGAKIANLAVDTLQIANSAVTLPVSTSATNLVSYSSGGAVSTTQTVDVLSATIVNPGIPMLLTMTFQGQSAAGDVTGYMSADPPTGTTRCTLELLRNGSAIIVLADQTIGSGGTNTVFFPNSVSFVDQPGAGTFTYVFRLTAIPSSSSFIFSYQYRFRALTLLGLKK